MFALLIVPILISGFCVCVEHPKVYYNLHRYEGQHLYLRVIQLGSYVVIYTAICLVLLQRIIPESTTIWGYLIPLSPVTMMESTMIGVVDDQLSEDHYARKISWILLLTGASIIVAYAWAYYFRFLCIMFGLINGVRNFGKVMLVSRVVVDHPIDQLLFTAWAKGVPVLITLKSGKVYAGIVATLEPPTEDQGPYQSIELVVGISGFRDRKKKPVLTTRYTNCKRPERLANIIPREEVSVISWFDHDFFRNTQLPEKYIPTQPPKKDTGTRH